MPPHPDRGRRLLPLLTGGRARVTCRYRCGDQCSQHPPNTSDNPYFGDLVQRMLDRRGLFRAGAVVAVSTAAASSALASAAAAAPPSAAAPRRGLDFVPVKPNLEDAVVVPEGFQQGIVIRWGDPILPGAPEFDFEAQTPEAQERQFGFNNDFCALLPLRGDLRLMVNNHEYTSEEFIFRGYDPENPTEQQVRIAWAAHGLSVVVLETGDGAPEVRMHRLNRRITLNTEFEVRGPAAGSDLLKTSADPTGTKVFGTMNNCSGGVTPWGTVLSGEENIHFYFANADQVTDPATKARLTRYGMQGTATERKWERYDSRWDLARQPNEANRFGWIVELDPYDPESRPVKHTALGRFKHEGANVHVLDDGRVAAYLGDDEKFEYMYKFVSDKKMKRGDSRHARRHNMSLLDSGTLYVARFSGDSPAEEIDGTGKLPSDGRFDGTGEWIALAHNDESFVPGMTAEEVYVFARLAADAVGATKMDRPEDVQPHPKTGRVYAALTNNSDRGTDGKAGADETNPRNSNKHGQVLELAETGRTTFTWNLLLVCGDPNDPATYYGGFDKSQVSPITCPDNVAFDSGGDLWITTDSSEALAANDGLYRVPLEGEERGHVMQFLSVPRGAEACGPVIEDDLVLVSAQHPGELDGASADNPVSHWPDGGDSQPRPSVVAVWR
ncbi:PhoX family protein [Saccharopolyspora erythraea]|uniref:PhoX family protein n=1 Tax=Saccharopolyspora erythraea TaxID=1836 RepID=UPI001BABEF86|nr:PhoX family phosphatase [Saccharopolyspora erythraea]QUH05608.1 PhoX family protein [Saccharopolyspora erythraea]